MVHMMLIETKHNRTSKLNEINPNVKIVGEYAENPEKVACQCKRCEHQWDATLANLIRGKGCPKCGRKSGTSFMEQFVCVALEAVLGKDKVSSRNRSMIGMELDILVPPGFAVEMGGWRWHKDKVYGRDAEKRRRCREKGIHLVTIYDNVPEDAVVPVECRRYSFDLASEEDHVALKSLTVEILSVVCDDWEEKLPEWIYIERMAAIRASCRSHERFVAEMKEKSPTIIIESQYTRGYTKVACRCAVCGYVWKAIPDSLLKGYGCPDCGRKKTLDVTRKTHEQFVSELMESNPAIKVKGRYVNAVTKIECLCEVCGCEWKVVPDSLLQGTGCPDCGKKKNHDSLRKTHEQFVAELAGANPSVKVLGEYVGAKIKTECLCITCGHRWMVAPDHLLQGTGCPKCGIIKRASSRRKTHEQFVAELERVHPEIEALGKYETGKAAIPCRCKTCGHVWDTRPDNLLQGKGCPKCSRRCSSLKIAETKRMQAKSRRKTYEQFVFELAKINPAIEVIESMDAEAKVGPALKIQCLCKTCERVWTVKVGTLLRGSSCPRCVRRKAGKSRRKTHEQFVADLASVNPKIEALGKYEGKKTKIPCRCKTCGHVWDTTPSSLLQGNGCPACKTRNFVKRMAEKRKSTAKS